MKHNSKPMGCSKSGSKREVYSNTILPKETRKTSTRKPNFTPKATGRRRRRRRTKISRRKEIIKIRADMNEKERNNQIRSDQSLSRVQLFATP